MLDENLIDRLLNNIKTYANGREVVMYGRSAELQEALEKKWI